MQSGTSRTKRVFRVARSMKRRSSRVLLVGGQRSAAIPAHPATLERGNPFGGTAEHTSGFELPDHDRVVLDADLEFVSLVDVEETACLSRHNNPAEVVNLANHNGIQR